MNRRDFLAAAGIVVLAGVIGFGKPQTAEAQFLRKLYQGTADGKLLESTDGGKTWHQVVNFGEQYTVNKVTVDRSGTIYVQLGYMGGTFDLYSSNLLVWRTLTA